MLKFIVRASLFVTILLSITLAMWACGSGDKGEKTNDANSWILKDDGSFGTNDLTLAQGELPFTIIAPTYLPENLPSKPSTITGLTRDYWPEEELEIDFTYQSDQESNPEAFVYIREINHTVLQLGSGDPDRDEFVEIHGITISVQRDAAVAMADGGTDLKKGFCLSWNQNGIFVDVSVSGCGYEEALKVIESMVEQGKKAEN